jgi:hypothetical protein
MTCSCNLVYQCSYCGRCYYHDHESGWRSDKYQDTEGWFWYGVEKVPGWLPGLVTVGTKCFHKAWFEKGA